MKRLRELRQRPAGLVVLGTLALLAGLAVLAVLVLSLLTLWWSFDLPPLDKAVDYRPRQHLQVLAADGSEIAQFGSERRVFVPIAQTPQALKQAVLAVEDAGFYEHSGISWKGVVRAAWSNLTGGIGGGASTITQQVSRTFFLSTQRTLERKVKEALIARQLEQTLSKDEILELYLNQIYLGQRAYGYGAAAQVYFGKPLAQLNLAESAMLAGLQQNPIYANPINNAAAATKRQRWVLDRMQRTGAITEAQEAEALAFQLVYRKPAFVEVQAQHVAEMARRAVVERLGEKAYTEGVRVHTSLVADEQRAAHAALRRALLAHERRQPWRGPEGFEALPADADGAAGVERAAGLALKDGRDDDDLRLAILLAASPRELVAQLASGERVTLRGDSLRWVQSALAPGAPPSRALRRGSIVRLMAQPGRPGAEGKTTAPTWVLAQWPQAEGAYVALDPSTGRIRALVGGFSFTRSQFNRVTSAWRQPGSSFKPFLYSAALEQGVMPETLVNDAPLIDAAGNASPGLRPGNWNPQNSDGNFDGEISVREGLVRSKNLVSIRVLDHIGMSAARQWITRFGFELNRHPNNLTLALGTGSTTALQMAAAYAVFANGGHRVAPVLIEKIVDARGQVLYEAPPPRPLDASTRVIPARNAFLVNTLMRDVTARGTAARAQGALGRSDVYGKTGTTNDAVDAWFAGWAPGVAAVAWIGHDEPKSLGERESGGGLALPVWIDAVASSLRGVNFQPLYQPEDVVAIEGDWRYVEYEAGGFVVKVGEAELPISPEEAAWAALPAVAASAPAAAASTR
ncbi:penicillin-binding protein [beta proteobacterium AAP121]|nr:penicillin-binding protein [beta proteobacterium AAP65]KPG00335.1 penicillin-binding protein [beta proteobacterium AAP121]